MSVVSWTQHAEFVFLGRGHLTLRHGHTVSVPGDTALTFRN